MSLAIVVDFLNKWQTLIAGAAALVAAFVALRPVYGQLALMRGQNRVMLRSTISEMIVQLDNDVADVREIVTKPIGDFLNDCGHFEQSGNPLSMAQWASERGQDIHAMNVTLKRRFSRFHDVEAVESQKQALLDAVKDVSSCLSTICAPELCLMFPEDYNWTEEEEKAAAVAATEAEQRIFEIASMASVVRYALFDRYEDRRAALVRRLRMIDDSLLS